MTKPQYDWADSLAVDLMSDTFGHSYERARQLIAMKVKAVHLEGQRIGMEEAVREIRKTTLTRASVA